MYKVEDLKFYNQKDSYVQFKNKKIYYNDTTIEDKVALIDELYGGFASYMLELFDKFQKEKDTIKKDNKGNYITISFNNWVKKNDKRHLLKPLLCQNDKKQKYYVFLNKKYNIEEGEKAKFYYGLSIYPLLIKDDTISQWYNDLIEELISKETAYFKQHNLYYQKIQKIKNYEKRYGNPLNSEDINDICFNGKENIKEETLDRILILYKKYEILLGQLKEEFKDID